MCHRTRALNKFFESLIFAPALARIERIAVIFHQAKDGSIGCLDLFTIDILRTGYTKDAVLPETIATAILRVRCRSRPRQAAAQAGPASDLALAQAGRSPAERLRKMHLDACDYSSRRLPEPAHRSHRRPLTISPCVRVRREWGSHAGCSDLGSCNDARFGPSVNFS